MGECGGPGVTSGSCNILLGTRTMYSSGSQNIILGNMQTLFNKYNCSIFM